MDGSAARDGELGEFFFWIIFYGVFIDDSSFHGEVRSLVSASKVGHCGCSMGEAG